MTALLLSALQMSVCIFALDQEGEKGMDDTLCHAAEMQPQYHRSGGTAEFVPCS